MPKNENIIENLRSRGFRLTPHRLAIMQIIEEKDGHLSPIEIYEQAVQKIPGLTEATVYRTLEWLARNGLVLVAHIGDGRLVYETARHHHHHLICRECGYTINIEHDLLKDLYAQISQQTGFNVDQVHVTFFGLCPECDQAVNHPVETGHIHGNQ